jgi:chaperonin GroEL
MTDQFYEAEAREKLLKGAEKLYNAVKTTMGPRGRNVVIGQRGAGPTVTHDGVTVAKAVHVRDEAENIGAELIKEAANKLNDVAGDGTTTVSVLTYHMLEKAGKLINGGKSPMQLSREVEDALDEVMQYLIKLRQPADKLDTLQKIATISGGNEEIGKVVAEVVHKVGPTGTVTVEAVPRPETTSEFVDGLVVERGFLSPYMVTDEARMTATYNNPAVIIIHGKIYSFREIVPLLEKIDGTGLKEAVIIAEDVINDALPSLVLNNVKGVFRTLCIKAPSFGSAQRQILDDLAVATGATVIAPDTIPLVDAQLDVIGKAGTVIATRERTTFVGLEKGLQERIKWLDDKINAAGSEYEKEQLEKRRANLAGQVAVIHVGGQTETEIEEKKFRVDDAVAATKAAMAEGVLPGGGVVLYNAPVSGKTDGAKLLSDVLKEPFRQLILNSGIDLEDAELAIRHGVKNIKAEHKGYNVKTGELVDLLKEGIVDPYTVTRQALATSVSLGVVGMTAGALIVEDEQK